MNLVPPKLSLLPFQAEAVTKMLKFLKLRRCCYNASEMGLGKTIQTIVTLNALDVSHVLILCPNIMMYTWKEEIEKWSNRDFMIIKIIKKSSDTFGIDKANFIITTYDLAVKLVRELSMPWDVIVCDEAHYIKNPKAKRTKATLKIWECANYKIALSGTPFTRSVEDGFTVFNKMAPETFPSHEDYVNTFCYQRHTQWGPQWYGSKNPSLLYDLIRAKFYIRYEKKDVLTQLPEKLYQKIILGEEYAVKVPKDSIKILDEEINAVLKKLDNNQDVGLIPTSLAGERRQQGLKKIKPIADFVKELIDGGESVVLFAYHRDVIAEYEKIFKLYGAAVITGSTTAIERGKQIERFQAGTTKLFIGQIKASGIGITLTKSSICVMGELDWSPSIINQAVDRLHRIGQTKAVTIYYFVVKDSVDQRLDDTVIAKTRIFNKILNEQNVEASNGT